MPARNFSRLGGSGCRCRWLEFHGDGGLLDVGTLDRAAGAASLQCGEIHAELGGDLPRQRRSFHVRWRGHWNGRDRSARVRVPRGRAAAGAGAAPSPRTIASTVPTGTCVPGSTSSFLDRARGEDLDIDDALVGLDERHDVAALHGVAGLHLPRDERAGLHVRPERRHAEFTGHG